MQESVNLFVQSVVEAFDLQGPIYEFGYSPGRAAGKASSPVHCAIDIGYVGSDLREDVEIDRLEELSRLPYPSGSARTVSCLNVLEHVYEPQRAVDEILRLLAPGGILLLSTSLHSEASKPLGNYWRISPQGIERLLEPLEATLVAWQGPEQSPHTVFGIGCKGPVPSTFLAGIRPFLEGIERRLDEAAQQTRRSTRLRNWLWGWTRSQAERQRRSQRHQLRFALHFPMDHRVNLPHVLLGTPLLDGKTGTRVNFLE
jgi:SAM-dependent methyltransferase